MRRTAGVCLFLLLLGFRPLAGQSDCSQTKAPASPSKDAVEKLVEVLTPDSEGKPVPGIQVTVTSTDEAGKGDIHTYTTNPDGCFVFPAITGVDYRISTHPPGYGRSDLSWTPSGFPTDASDVLIAPLPPPGKRYDPSTGSFVDDQAGSNGQSSSDAAHASADGQAGLQPGVPDNSGNQSASQGEPWWLTFLLSLLAAFAYLALQEITCRVVAASMMKQGDGAQPSAVPSALVEQASDPAPAPAVHFLEMSASMRVELSGDAAERLKRIRGTERRKFVLVLVALLAQLAGAAGGLGVAYAVGSTGTSLPFLLVLAILDVFAFFWAANLYFARKRILEVSAVVDAVVVLIVAIFATFMRVPFYTAFLAAGLQILVVWLGWRRMRAGILGAGNNKLVILRVFGSDRNAASTFGDLMSGWRFAGAFLTIADPSYVRYQFSVFTRGNRTRSLIAVCTIGTLAWLLNEADSLVGTVPHMHWLAAMSTPGRHALIYIAVSIAAILPTVAYTRKRFLKTPDEAVRRVEQMDQATLTIESDYYGSAYFCYDNVWKPAVHKMLAEADLLMMDLRGFSEQRQGCRYEIGELVDRYPLSRALFLVDKTTPRELLAAIMKERWASIRHDSPNRGIAQARIYLYETGNKPGKDNRNILAVLAGIVRGRLDVQAGKITCLDGAPEAHPKKQVAATAGAAV